MIIIGGILQHNPFFVPPEQFLRELRERSTGQTNLELDDGLTGADRTSPDDIMGLRI